MNVDKADGDDAGRRERAAIVAEAMQVAGIGEVQVSEEWHADAARFVAGEITAHEMVERNRARSSQHRPAAPPRRGAG